MTSQEAERLRSELEKHFGGDVQTEEVAEGRYRFGIVSVRFAAVPHLARQDDVWQFVDTLLTREQVLDISLILTYAPADLEPVAHS